MKQSYKVTRIFLYKHSDFDLMYRFTYPAAILSSHSPEAESMRTNARLSCCLDLTGPGKRGKQTGVKAQASLSCLLSLMEYQTKKICVEWLREWRSW